MPADQHDLFPEDTAAELFDRAYSPKAYVPDPRHVRNRLEDLLRQLRDAHEWPWEPVIVRMRRDKTLPYLLGLLPDREEAERWRADFATEIVRLEPAEAA